MTVEEIKKIIGEPYKISKAIEKTSRRIIRKKEEKQKLKSKLEYSGISSDGGSCCSGFGDDKIGCGVALLEEYDREINSYIRKLNNLSEVLVEKRQEVKDIIALLNEDKYKDVLEYRHLDFMSWNGVAETMGYSEDWVKHMNGFALKKIAELYKFDTQKH